ncbi:MAG: hypothetical protein HOE11_01025 [Candidatus Diapherotrites archaeon]|jgi:hypothetical protein|nr:hypothetical protein [Candidatus Diapherotrites archaeon]MBT4596590.1 hypothetical protein [Candidatus Diapherotrites archaeon]
MQSKRRMPGKKVTVGGVSLLWRGSIPHNQVKNIWSLYNKGASARDIAAKTGVSPVTSIYDLIKRLREAGVPVVSRQIRNVFVSEGVGLIGKKRKFDAARVRRSVRIREIKTKTKRIYSVPAGMKLVTYTRRINNALKNSKANAWLVDSVINNMFYADRKTLDFDSLYKGILDDAKQDGEKVSEFAVKRVLNNLVHVQLLFVHEKQVDVKVAKTDEHRAKEIIVEHLLTRSDGAAKLDELVAVVREANIRIKPELMRRYIFALAELGVVEKTSRLSYALSRHMEVGK